MTGALYELEGVRRVFRVGGSEVRAVDGVDLEIQPGEFVAVQGPSGSGKTTLLQLLGALDRASSGSIRFAGRDLTKTSRAELTALRARELGFVFQSFNLIPTLTAAENIEAAMVPLGASRAERGARIEELLRTVGLIERRDHLPTLLSGGEQQRIAIARALSNSPRVILADEPTGNLDSTTSDELVEVLRELAKGTGVTVVIVTHAEEVAARAERRIRMRDGRLIDSETS